ncbi:uncharacterized protein ACWYII_040159 [Salvelinus alpinus]
MEGQVEFTLPSPCQQTLAGTQLVKWTGQSSPAEVKIQCQYSATGSQFISIYSEPSTVTIQDLPQVTVSSTVIRETESVQLSCETPPSLHVSHCYFYREGGKNLLDSSCTQTITGTELLKRADQTLPAVVKVTCYYAVGKSHTSPLSNPVSVTVQAVQLWQAAVGMSSGVGVFLMGLTAVCLYRRTKKTNSQRPTARQDDHRQYDLVMGAMSSAGMLDSRDAGFYSLITYVPSTFLPSGPFEENGK